MNAATFRAHISSEHLPSYCRELDADCPIDRWISFAVKVLRDGGIETYESCQGGAGHSFPEPTVRFHGTDADGFRALAVVMTFGLPVLSLRRFWVMTYCEPTGPHWELTFGPLVALKHRQRAAEKGGEI